MRHQGYVFGLAVETSLDLPIAHPLRQNGQPRVVIRESSLKQLAGWPVDDATVIADWRTRSGRRALSIQSHPDAGYRISGASMGTFVVSRDGREVEAALPSVSAWRWQRLMFSQALPLAAALQGLAPFHASAVTVGDRALAFVGSSGAGKTSIASYLASFGASFLTDDVLALDVSDGGVQAHPGPGVARVRAEVLRAIRTHTKSDVGEIVGRSDKLQVAITPSGRAVPLHALYFLDRSPSFTRLEITESRAPDPARVLSNSFVTYVSQPPFQLAHLDVCSRIATSVPVFEVSTPFSDGALETAQAIARHVGL